MTENILAKIYPLSPMPRFHKYLKQINDITEFNQKSSFLAAWSSDQFIYLHNHIWHMLLLHDDMSLLVNFAVEY